MAFFCEFSAAIAAATLFLQMVITQAGMRKKRRKRRSAEADIIQSLDGDSAADKDPPAHTRSK